MKENKSRSRTVPVSESLKDSESRSRGIGGEQLSWSSGKMIFILSLSVFLNIIFGPVLYNLDVYTEKFSEELINIPQDKDACKQYFDNEFNKVILECKTSPNKENCIDKITKIQKIGQTCFESESTAENQDLSKDVEEVTL